MEKYAPLRSLHPRVADGFICERVSWLWYHRGGTDQGPIKEYRMVLADNQGDSVHATVPHGFLHTFLDILHKKSVYELSMFCFV